MKHKIIIIVVLLILCVLSILISKNKLYQEHCTLNLCMTIKDIENDNVTIRLENKGEYLSDGWVHIIFKKKDNLEKIVFYYDTLDTNEVIESKIKVSDIKDYYLEIPSDDEIEKYNTQE